MPAHDPKSFLAKVPFYRRVWAERLPDYGDFFKRYNFFEVIPLDTGTYFDFLETGLDDRKIADSVIEGKRLKPWGGVLGNLDFNATKTYEQVNDSLWIQSFYAAAPIARTWRQSRETIYLETFKKYFFDWNRKNPLPQNMPAYLREEKEKMLRQTRCRGPVDRSWFDFDPAARGIYLCWSLFFLGEALSDDEYSVILASLCDHAPALLANFTNWPDMRGNHQCLWSLALLYLGYLLREESFSPQALRVGAEMLSSHFARENIFSDGSPSYAFFSLMHFRDGWALARRNGGADPVPQAALEKMHADLLGLIQPDGTVPALNDGYTADARPLLAIGAHLFNRPDWLIADDERYHEMEGSSLRSQELCYGGVGRALASAKPSASAARQSAATVRQRPAEPGSSRPSDFSSHKMTMELPGIFNESGFAVARTGREKNSAYVILDATRPLSTGKATHGHAGKLGFVYWARGELLVGDSGVGPYPEPLFGQWYRRARAHSTIMVDGCEDADYIGPWEWDHLPHPVVCEARNEKEYAFIHAKSDGFMRLKDPVEVERRLCLFPDGMLVIKDTMRAKICHKYEFIFRLAGGAAQVNPDGVTIRYLSGNVAELQIIALDTTPVNPMKIRRETGPFFRKTCIGNTPTVIFSTEATGPLDVTFGLLPCMRQHSDPETIRARMNIAAKL